MEKAGGMMKNEKLAEKGAVKREEAGANSADTYGSSNTNTGSGSYGSSDNYGSSNTGNTGSYGGSSDNYGSSNTESYGSSDNYDGNKSGRGGNNNY